MQVRRRIPIADTIVDVCRMLPEPLQAILLLGIPTVSTILFRSGFEYLIPYIIAVEVFFIGVLIQKNIVYRRISKIDQAIKYRILWVKTRRDGKKIIRYLICSSFYLLLGIGYYFYIENNQCLLIIILLLWVIYLMKGLFYVPNVFVRIIGKHEIEFVNEFQKEALTFEFYELLQITFEPNQLIIQSRDSQHLFPLQFDKLEERKRLRKFLEKTLEKVVIK